MPPKTVFCESVISYIEVKSYQHSYSDFKMADTAYNKMAAIFHLGFFAFSS